MMKYKNAFDVNYYLRFGHFSSFGVEYKTLVFDGFGVGVCYVSRGVCLSASAF